MTRKALVTFLLILTMLASCLQPCLATELAISEETQLQSDSETAIDDSQALEVDLPDIEVSSVQCLESSGDVTVSDTETAPDSTSGDLLDFMKDTPAPLDDPAETSSQDDPQTQDPLPPADENPDVQVGGTESQNVQDVPDENPVDQDAQDTNSQTQEDNPEAADAREAQEDSETATANDADSEESEAGEPEPEESEGEPLSDGAITRAAIKWMMTPNANKRLEIVFLDIGRNDGILLHCGGEYAFIDSGTRSYGIAALNCLRYFGVTRLKYYIGTHAHADHVGGAGPILAAIPTERIIVPHWGVVNMMLKKAKGWEKNAISQVPVTVMTYGQTITLGGASLQCIGPLFIKKCSTRSSKENINSLVLRVTYGQRSVLLTGDATPAELKQIFFRNASLLRVDVLKNPHHNANIKKCYGWFGMRYTVISTSRKAKPSRSLQNYVASVGSHLLCTAPNWNSHILLVTDGTSLQFYTTR